MVFKKFVSNSFSFIQSSIIMLFCCFFVNTPIHSQVQCAGEEVTDCVRFPFINYQCINVTNASAFQLYGNGTQLLPPSQSLTTPQYLIIKGFITFTTDYTFAEGTDIVFLDDNSGFRVSAGGKLTLEGCTLHGCNSLWAGVTVDKPNASNVPNTLVAKYSTFEDARAAIILRDKAIFEVSGCTFKKNVCGILAKSDAPQSTLLIPSISLTPNGLGISGNTFWGDEPLLEAAVPTSAAFGKYPMNQNMSYLSVQKKDAKS